MMSLLLVLCTSLPAQWIESRQTAYPDRENETIAVPYYHVPVPDDVGFGWGFYYDYGRLPAQYRSADYQLKCMRHMAAMGLNTFTLYGWLGDKDISDVALQVRLGVEAGLIGDFPLMILPCGEPEDVMGALEPLLPEGLPELVGYGPDEPGSSTDAGAQVASGAEKWQEQGVRCATAISAASAASVGNPLDIWIVHAPNLGDVPVGSGKELWMYDCELRGTNYALHRYYCGIYAFVAHKRMNVKSAWLWSYVDSAESGVFQLEDGSWVFDARRVCEHALPGPDGPIGTVGLDGIRDGIADFKVLYEVDRCGLYPEWIEWLCDTVPLNLWEGTDHPGGPEESGYFWDAPDIAKPKIDIQKTMEKAAEFLRQPAPD